MLSCPARHCLTSPSPELACDGIRPRPDWRETDAAGWAMVAAGPARHRSAGALDQTIALRVHLDDSTSENGPLRVLPDTHTRGILSPHEVETLARTVTPVECLAARGAVVSMRPLTVHASSKARTDQPRRVLHIEFASTVHLDRGIELSVG